MDTKLRLGTLFVLLLLGFYCCHVIADETPAPNADSNSDSTTKPAVTDKPEPNSNDQTSTPNPAQFKNEDKDATTQAPPKRKLKAVTLFDPPFVTYNLQGSDYEGLAVDILKEAIVDLNYLPDIDWSFPDDKRFGFEEEPGMWNGLVGQVQNKSADIAVAAFSITSKRSTVVEYSQPFMHAGYRVLYKIPDSFHASDFMVTILRPFTPGLWVLIVFMFFLTSLGLYIIGRFSPYEDIAFVGKTATYEGLNVPNSLLYTFSSLVLQGYTAAPKSISGRILTCVWWVFCVFTVSSYIAGLCVVLFRVNPEIRTLPFATLDELSRQSKVGLMVVNGSGTHRYLKSSPALLEKKLNAKIELNSKQSLVENTEKALDKLVQSDGKLAFIMDGPIAVYLTSQQPCNLMTVGEPLGEHSYAFICQKDSDLCQELSTKILDLKEKGRIWEIREKWLHQGCLADKPNNYIFEGLPFFDTFGGEPDAIMPMTITIRRFSSAFIILTIGIILAGLILVVEIFYAKRRGTAVPRKLERHGADDDMERIDNEFHDDNRA